MDSSTFHRIRALEARINILESIVSAMELRPQLRRHDLARHFTCSLRTINNAMRDGRLPKPKYFCGPMWSPAQMEGGKIGRAHV